MNGRSRIFAATLSAPRLVTVEVSVRETSDLTDTYELIDHSFYWDVRITRLTGGGHSMTYLLGPYFTKKKAKREGKRNLKSYVVRHKIKRVK